MTRSPSYPQKPPVIASHSALKSCGSAGDVTRGSTATTTGPYEARILTDLSRHGDRVD